MYLFVLIITFILKIVGLDYFGLDIDNPFMIKLNSFNKYNIKSTVVKDYEDLRGFR